MAWRAAQRRCVAACTSTTTLEWRIALPLPGWQVEQRDRRWISASFEFCFGIPIEQYLVGGQSRSIIRRAMRTVFLNPLALHHARFGRLLTGI